MKQITKDIFTSLFMGLVLPWLLLNFGVALLNNREAPVSEPVSTGPEQLPLEAKVRQEDGTVTAMDMDTYLEGVVLAEMPAWFETEALKAQAVVARTYTRKAWQTGGKHGDGSVCMVPSCCQGYRAAHDYLEQGGKSRPAFCRRCSSYRDTSCTHRSGIPRCSHWCRCSSPSLKRPCGASFSV